ncbi:unnamed protein product, partial [Pylaiella littoralis]
AVECPQSTLHGTRNMRLRVLGGILLSAVGATVTGFATTTCSSCKVYETAVRSWRVKQSGSRDPLTNALLSSRRRSNSRLANAGAAQTVMRRSSSSSRSHEARTTMRSKSRSRRNSGTDGWLSPVNSVNTQE